MASFFDKLKKQINPFDGGATWSNPKPQPARAPSTTTSVAKSSPAQSSSLSQISTPSIKMPTFNAPKLSVPTSILPKAITQPLQPQNSAQAQIDKIATAPASTVPFKQAIAKTNSDMVNNARKVITATRKNVAEPIVNTASKTANTVGSLAPAVAGASKAVVARATGNKQAEVNAVRNAKLQTSKLLNKGGGFGSQGGYMTGAQAQSRGGGWQGYKDNFIKPVAQASSEIAPLVIPAGNIGVAAGAKLGTKALAGATQNAAVTALTDPTNQLIQNGKVDWKQAGTNLALNTLLGAAIPTVTHGAGKVAQNSKPLDQSGKIQNPFVALANKTQGNSTQYYPGTALQFDNTTNKLNFHPQQARDAISLNVADAKAKLADQMRMGVTPLDQSGHIQIGKGQTELPLNGEPKKSLVSTAPIENTQPKIQPQVPETQIGTSSPLSGNTSEPIIPSNAVRTPEQGINQAIKTAQGKPGTDAAAKLIESVQKQGSTPNEIIQAIDPSRTVKTNTETWNNAGKTLYQLGDDGALNYFHENHGADANAVAWRLYEKRLANGDSTGAQTLLADMTTRSIENGQAAQAWAMIQRLDPKYIVQKIERQVQQFSNKVSPTLRSRIDWSAEKQAKIMQAATDIADSGKLDAITKANTPDSIAALTGITDKKILKGLANTADPERVKMLLTANLNKELNSIIPSGLGDKTMAYWKSGLLSAPVTHVRNIVGNTVNGGFNAAETPIAGMLDATVGRLLTPTKRTVSANPLTGMGRGIKNGARDFADAIQHGMTQEDVGKYNYKSINWNTKNPAEKYIFKPFTDAIFRTLGAEDKIFKAPGVLTSLYNQADAAAISAGKRGDVKWMTDWIENAPAIVKETAKAEGGAWVFQKDTVVSTGMRGLRDAIKRSHPGYEKIVEAIQPFVNVPAAIGSDLLTYTPGGLLRAANKSRKALDKNISVTIRDTYRRAAMKDLAKTTVGGGIIAAGMAMGYNGDATGNMPQKNTKEYDQWVLENRQPNSIKVGNKWINVNSIGPQLSLFNAAAQTGAQIRRDAAKGKQTAGIDTGINLLGSVGTNFLNSSSLTGATDASNALKDPVRYAQGYVARQGTSLIPNIAKRTGSGLDPYARDPQNFKEAVQAQIPIARNGVTPKTDVTGTPVANNAYGVPKALLDPFNIATDKSGAVSATTKNNAIMDASTKAASLKEAKAGALKQFGFTGKSETDVRTLADAGDKNAAEAVKYLDRLKVALGDHNTGKPKNYDNLSTEAKAVYDKQASLTSDGQKTWLKSKTSDKTSTAYNNINAWKPTGLPEVPNNNQVAKIYADYESKAQAGDWNATRKNEEKKAALREAYNTALTENDKWVLKASTALTKTAVDNGDLSVADLKRLAAQDNINVALGGTAQLSKTTRLAYGLGLAPVTGSGSTKSGGSKSKLTFSPIATSTNSAMFSLLKSAKIGKK